MAARSSALKWKTDGRPGDRYGMRAPISPPMISSDVIQPGSQTLPIVSAVLPVLNPLGDARLRRAFYPLTIPLTVDPGAIAVAVMVGSNHDHSVEFFTINIFAATIGGVLMALTIFSVYRFARRFGTWIGHTGMAVVVWLSALIVVCIGVQICWDGVKGWLAEIGYPH